MKGLIELDSGKRLQIPLTLHEITFGQFCDFRTYEGKYLESVKVEQEASEEGSSVKDPARSLSLLTKALSFIFGPAIYDLPVSSGNSFSEAVDSGRYFKPFQSIDDYDLTLFGCYSHLFTLIQGYKTDHDKPNFTVEVRGQKYELDRKRAGRILLGYGLTTGETIEILEYQRRAAKLAEDNPSEEGNIDFNLGINEVAILLRKKGEQLPASESEMKEWLKERRQVFKEVPLATVLDLRFFLLHSLTYYVKTRGFSSFGKGSPKPSQVLNIGKLMNGVFNKVRKFLKL